MKRITANTLFVVIAGTLLLSGCQKDNAEPTVSSSASAPASSSASSTPVASVKPSALTAIALDSDGIVVAPGSMKQLQVTALLKDNKKAAITGASGISYVSSKPSDITIDEKGNIKVGAAVPTGTTATVTVTYEGKSQTCNVVVKYSLDSTIKTVNGKATVTNENDLAVLVNKKRALPADYVPANLVYPNIPFSFSEKIEKRMLQGVAAKALEQLVAGADKDGIKLYGVSGYRSYKTQVSVFNNNVKTQGEELARKYSAEPGQSEHQTGLSIDVSSKSAGYALEEVFATTAEGKWLAQHCAEYGFIIRYPKGKESITGYEYEPWHIRYVGVDMAKDIMSKGITLEEYFQDAVAVSG